MRTHATTIAVTGFLIFCTLVFGLLLSRNLERNDPRLSGKPLAGAESTVHKLLALATAILLAMAIRNLHRGTQFGSIEWTVVLVAAGAFAFMIISGSWLSLGRTASHGLQVAHQAGALLATLSTSGVVYLLVRGR